ncbi:MAG: molybdopterin synthase catalytic subunit MoaE [Thiohalocapsa sp.]|jgi:molybdopterin synthase catalytic subunit|uniref:molybdopterin synthase catalytic subunit MoaE n=1 Tax=Thiohalocapsa sp. TaxID=2497641 RepID=UPI0025CC89AE|nr:molybdopterin synthase catalytic subunit MoaE [Thiohalocapsa sp.]MCG6940280.1 molybdopterin synthase catalytic subunit MoaE [Thiohalocapsa sp.]
MSRIDIRIETEPFDPWTLQADLARDDPGSGALAAFVGLMRDHNAGASVTAMTLEHYPGMTERALREIAEQAIERFALRAVRIVHRIGRVLPTDPLVLVAVTAGHRGEAFRGCEFLMDYLKTRAPFWKKEETAQGARWVEARDSDTDAAARWRNPAGD